MGFGVEGSKRVCGTFGKKKLESLALKATRSHCQWTMFLSQKGKINMTTGYTMQELMVVVVLGEIQMMMSSS